jgi:CRP-like cAMP-binding protein
MKWGAVLIAINLYQLYLLEKERRTGILPKREAAVYEQFFSGLVSETAFLKIVQAAEWERVHRGTQLTIQGAPNEFLYLVYDGGLQATRDGQPLGLIPAGSWVGERGFLRQFVLTGHLPRESSTGTSYATTTVVSESAGLVRWRRDELLEAVHSRPAVQAGVLLSITCDLLAKLDRSSKVEESHALALIGYEADTKPQAGAGEGCG